MSIITGKEHPLKVIFSKEFEFKVPSYQRPFSWTTEEAGELLDDLISFMDSEDENDSYFLGSIVLIKDKRYPEAEIIDGQQRLTTLTILMAVLASKLQGRDRANFESYVNEPGNRIEGLEEKPRLTLRERDQNFFRKFIQGFNFDELERVNEHNLNDSQKNIKQICSFFASRLDEESMQDQERFLSFCQFLVNRCYLVAVSTPNIDSAYRVFTVLNNRGLDLLPSDLLKAFLIGELTENQRKTYTERWEDLEVDLGRDRFNDLFSHIRMIFRKAKQKKNIFEEFKEFILENIKASTFIDNKLLPFGEAYQIITSGYQESEEIKPYLDWLLRIDNSDWIPPAILFLATNKDGNEASFFKNLEILAAYMFLERCGINDRIERYSKILNEIENGTVLNDDSHLHLTEEEKARFLTIVSGDVYLMQNNPRKYLMLRVDSFCSEGEARYDYKITSIEHVLPQTLNDDWRTFWNTEDQKKWIHKIGNLVLLSRRKNAAASNYNFKNKKQQYFAKNGVSSYALTTTVLNEESWTPEIVEARQRRLIEVISNGWSL